MKKLILAGGSGFIGQELIKKFDNSLFDVYILTRKKNVISKYNEKYVYWSGIADESHLELFENAHAIINLTGKNINCRFTESNKKQLVESRVKSTASIARIISLCENPSKIWINFSGIARYMADTLHAHTEKSQEYDTSFLGVLAEKWEKTMSSTETKRTRKIIVRTGIVLDKKHGALSKLYPLAKYGLGGYQGSGIQMISWIHKTDLVCAIQHIMDSDIQGIVNLCGPNPKSNREFMKILRKVVKMPIGLPAWAPIIKFSALILGTEPELILKGHNVIPKKLTAHGFNFKFSNLEKALNDLLC